MNFDKKIFQINEDNVVGGQWCITTYSLDYLSQHNIFVGLQDLMELRDYLDGLILREVESRKEI